MLDTEPFQEFEKNQGDFPDCGIKDEESAFLELINYDTQCEVEIVYKNGTKMSIDYWGSAKDLLQLWNSSRGKEITLAINKDVFVTINKEEVLYKIVRNILKKNK